MHKKYVYLFIYMMHLSILVIYYQWTNLKITDFKHGIFKTLNLNNETF